MAINRTSPKKGKVVDIPDATITIGDATADDSQVSVAFTVATTPSTGGPVQKYTAISNPGSFTGDATASPVVVSGLTNGTAYTFQVAAANATGRGPLSSASASATPVVVGDYYSIATVSLAGGAANTITFSSIPQTYKHLQLRAIYRGTSDPGINMYINGDSTHGNYYMHSLYGDGATNGQNAVASNPYITYYPENGTTANVFGTFVMDILDYTNASKYKTSRTIWGYDNNGSGQISALSQLYKGSTSAVTSIVLQNEYSLNLAQYSHFALYGIKG